MVSLAQQVAGEAPIADDNERFEGPEKTLTLCFKHRKLQVGSLRLIPRERWTELLRHAKCEILSCAESGPACQASCQAKGSKHKKVVTKGITAYLLSESALFVTDAKLSLKTCGRTTPLAALEPILDAVVPNWRKTSPEAYLAYACFSRLGYMFPDDQPEPHTCWSDEVAYLDRFFAGEPVVLGSTNRSQYHVYVANYQREGDLNDFYSTQVALTKLDSHESMTRFVEGGAETESPLKGAWRQLHGDDPRSIASEPTIDDFFFQPVGYSANGIFGQHFTTVHATPQPSCSYISIETSMPMTQAARHSFVLGAQRLCKASVLTLTGLFLCPSVLTRQKPAEVPGFQLQQSSVTVGRSFGSRFGCALHYYTCKTPKSVPPSLVWPLPGETTEGVATGCVGMSGRKCREQSEVPVLEVREAPQAAILAAQRFFSPPAPEDPILAKDYPVALVDIGAVKRRAELWRRHLPRVEPFYAVKCNGHPALVRTLLQTWQEWGCGGFDCASPAEMASVAAIGADLGRQVIYANPCKQESALAFAQRAGVRRIVFDNAAELAKLQRLHPTAELLLRVQTDDSLAQCPLSNKFGARVEDCRELLGRARELGLSVVGVSFHVGSGCSQVGAFRSALMRARALFDEMHRAGLTPTLLDIGGGFPGTEEPGQASFADHAGDIRPLLDELFPSPSVQVIAEPGRFFAATAQAALATVISVADTAEGSRYYLSDGVYGMFNCLVYDHAALPKPTVLRKGTELPEGELEKTAPGTLFGPTCDGFDTIAKAIALPRLQVGDRLLFPNMGAYSSSASTCFNGFAPAACFAYESRLVGGPGEWFCTSGPDSIKAWSQSRGPPVSCSAGAHLIKPDVPCTQPN